MIGTDTESTGLYIYHGCRPFAISTYNDNGDDHKYWEFRVNPLTRVPIIPIKQKRDVEDYLNSDPEGLVFHNLKFDYTGLRSIGIRLPKWKLLHDTNNMSHVWNSAEPHYLKGLCAKYLNIPDDDQKELLRIVTKARRIAKKLGWAIASSDHPHFSPANGKAPKSGWPVCDMWIPRELALFVIDQNIKNKGNKNYKPLLTPDEVNHFLGVCKKYAMLDAERTLLLWYLFNEFFEEDKNYTKQYLFSRATISVAYSMEKKGVNVLQDNLNHVIETTGKKAKDHFDKAVKIALKSLPDKKTFNPNSWQQLSHLIKDKWKLPLTKMTKGGNVSTDESVIIDLTFRENADPRMKEFGKNLILGRKYAKSNQYGRLFKSAMVDGKLHPSIHLTGTDTTRQSVDSPPTQIVSKDRDESKDDNEELRDLLNQLWRDEIGLRRCFGPAPGRMWLSADYSQLQLRIFAYISQEKDLINAFIDGHDAHDYIAKRIFKLPDGVKPSKMERRIGKNTNFGFIFGASVGKIEATAGRPGLWGEVTSMFPNAHKFMKTTKSEVGRNHRVFTPGGYPLVVDQVHKGVNYKVQGSEGELVKRAMIDCHRYLVRNKKLDAHIIMVVHDEIVIDMPRPEGLTENDITYKKLPHILDVKNIMENAGMYYKMITPVSPEIILERWDKGIPIK